VIHRLFTKIFLAFFATVIAISLLILATTGRRRAADLPPGAQRIVEDVGRNAVAAYERGDAAGLAGAVATFTPSALLFDATGTLLTVPDPATADVARFVTRRLRIPGEPVGALVVTSDVILAPVDSPDRRHYFVALRTPQERALAVLAAVDQSPMIRLAIIAIVAAGICFWLARHITAPLAQLRAATQQVAGGRLNVAADPALTARRDEIGALGRDFNRMTEHLAALAVAERRLLADVSHELRSPLTRLTVALGLARQQKGEPDTHLDRIEHEAANLDRGIGQLLALARADSGVDDHERQPTDVTALVDEVIADADFEARAINRRVVGEAATPWVRSATPDLLRSAVENVVRNAVRHTGPGTTVQVSTKTTPATLTIVVRDHGPGIPIEELGELFRPFRRGRASAATPGGMGLGLAIAERAMQRHGGSIRASNAADGGLVVELHLPAEEASASRDDGVVH
jgi:two-component system sensor histidine kinase CpxA